MKHTPTPWTLEERDVAIPFSPKTWHSCEIFDGDHTMFVATVNSDNPSQIADANFIVRACNAHDALVAALEKIDQMGGLHEAPTAFKHVWREVIQTAQSALAEAEGR